MKRVIKLTERDLTRIVKRVVNEGVAMITTYTSDSANGPSDTFELNCGSSPEGMGTLNPTEQYKNNPYLKRGNQILPLNAEAQKFFCKS